MRTVSVIPALARRPAAWRREGKNRNEFACGRRTLNVILPIHIRENIVARFALSQKIEIDLMGEQLVVKPVETQDMVLRPLGCVFHGGACFHEKRPIARLREKKFPRQLF